LKSTFFLLLKHAIFSFEDYFFSRGWGFLFGWGILLRYLLRISYEGQESFEGQGLDVGGAWRLESAATGGVLLLDG
jgi:hypothetical protein